MVKDPAVIERNLIKTFPQFITKKDFPNLQTKVLENFLYKQKPKRTGIWTKTAIKRSKKYEKKFQKNGKKFWIKSIDNSLLMNYLIRKE